MRTQSQTSLCPPAIPGSGQPSGKAAGRTVGPDRQQRLNLPGRTPGDGGEAACGGWFQDTELDRHTFPRAALAVWPAPGWKPQPRGRVSPRRRLGITGAEFCAGAKILLRAPVDLRRGTGWHRATSPAARRQSPALPSRGSPAELRRFPARWAEGLDRIALPAVENPVSLQPRLRRESRSVQLGQGLQGTLGAGWVGDPPGARGLWQPLQLQPGSHRPCRTPGRQLRSQEPRGRDCGSGGPCSQGGKTSKDSKGEKNRPKTSLNCPKGTLFAQTPAGSQSAAFWCSSIGKVFIPHWLWGERKKK
ncbi:uncharacterized protein [Haliaeetus albicilla]|uniref:uncharacterized protein n=1 Tax=Haliaeetus albicilla TaxID=8969 RepID=UPI0037E839EB